MIFAEVHLRFAGFTPAQSLQNLIREKLEEIRDLAPYDSDIQWSLEKKKSIYCGDLSITSPVGRFEAHSSRRSPQEVCDDLEKQLMEQLDIWKSIRFTDETDDLASRGDGT